MRSHSTLVLALCQISPATMSFNAVQSMDLRSASSTEPILRTTIKRSADAIPRPSKLWKSDEMTSNKAIPVGPKARVTQSYVLMYNPRLEVTISLKGLQPEIRFASPEGILILTAKDFLEMANQRDDWMLQPIYLDECRLSSTDDEGLYFLQYAMDPQLLPALFDIPKEGVRRLYQKLDFMCTHVKTLQASENVFSMMESCIIKTLKAEYVRHRSLQPACELFDELHHLILCHASPSAIIQDFLNILSEQGLTCPFNHYHVCNIMMTQRAHLRSLF